MAKSLGYRRVPARFRRRSPCASRPACRPWMESLEDRSLLSTFHVTNVNDSGLGSLRQAILDANAQITTPNRIDFSGRVNRPISLLTALPALDNDVTIRPDGNRHVTVQRSSAAGTPDFRVFIINAARTVTIDNLTIANGRVTGDVGGGILNLGTLFLEDSIVTGNTSLRDTTFVGGRGGGIQNSGTLTVEESQVAGNTADINGGGIANGTAQAAGTLTIEESRITCNSAAVGAGLMNTRGGATVDETLVADNTGVGDGAGIRSNVATTLTITDSTISGNTSGPFGTGGLASGAALTIGHTLIRGNSGAAAGVYLFGSADALISSSTIFDNVTNNPGSFSVGGVWKRGSGTLRIEETTISGNVGGFAGGVFRDFSYLGDLEIVRSTISGNTARGGGLTLVREASKSSAAGRCGSRTRPSATTSAAARVGCPIKASGNPRSFARPSAATRATWRAGWMAGLAGSSKSPARPSAEILPSRPDLSVRAEWRRGSR